MYIIFPAVLIFLLILGVLFCQRRRRLIRLIRCLSLSEKICRLNQLLKPFGFDYQLTQDVFLSRPDAWQREFGYCWLYDEAAPGWGMIFDCEPVYFDYHGHTWLMEFWKGQYGINIGAEAGIYRAEGLIEPEHRSTALFHAAPDTDLPVFDLELRCGTVPVFHIARRHWWLAGFRMGRLDEPEVLTLKVSVTFPSGEMLTAFLGGCKHAGFSCQELYVCDRTVSFILDTPHSIQPRSYQPLICGWTRWRNRCFLSLYRIVSAPFCCTNDRLLYLFSFLPFFPGRVLCRCRKKQFPTGR